MSSLREAFERDGYVVLRGFFDVERELAPLQRELGGLIDRAVELFGEHRPPLSDPAAFDAGYVELVERHPGLQPVVYDMAKAMPSFHRLVANERVAATFRDLRATDLCGTALGTSGIRIDRPGDERHMAPWHQEFPYQFRSLDGVTFWAPLVPVAAETGPVVLARGSQREGVIEMLDSSGTADEDMRRGEYGSWRIPGAESLGDRYELVQVESEPGDLLAFDFLTLHASAPNLSARARWSVQIRYFNFRDPYGTSIRWAGGVHHGKTFAQVNEALRTAAGFLAER